MNVKAAVKETVQVVDTCIINLGNKVRYETNERGSLLVHLPVRMRQPGVYDAYRQLEAELVKDGMSERKALAAVERFNERLHNKEVLRAFRELIQDNNQGF